MKTTATRSEQGQILILIVLSIVGLLGFAALAIDGGMIYSERRVAQNAADAAAYAGAASLSQTVKNYNPGDVVCTEFDKIIGDTEPNSQKVRWNTDGNKKQTISQAAIARAADNNFTLRWEQTPANVTANDNAVWMVCGFNSALSLTFVDVHVRITDPVSTSLMHLFYNGPAVNTVDSVVRVYPPEGVATGASIVGLCTTNSRQPGPDSGELGIDIGGSSRININVGRVISNCHLKTHGGQASAPWHVPDDMWYLTAPPQISGTSPLTAETQIRQATAVTTFPFDFSGTLASRCSAAPNGTVTVTNLGQGRSVSYYTPGRYNNISVGNNESAQLAPGLYCINGYLRVNGGGISGATDTTRFAVYAKDVTFFMPQTADYFSITGGDNYITAATAQCYQGSGACTTIPGNLQPIRGLFMWNETDASNDAIQINGNSNSTFEGTLAAPYQDVTLNGDSSTTSFGLQVIADTVTINGGGTLNIYYDGSRTFATNTQLGLER